MQKIKFIADSASDIPDEMLLEYDIDMPSVPITIDGKGYFERRSFTIKEFYKLLAATGEIPATSRVPVEDYKDCYERAFARGYTDIINVTINAGGSATNESAHMAAAAFFEEHPDAQDKLKIHIVDSKTYTMAYGWPVVEGARMARNGRSAPEILGYLYDFFDRCEIYLACYSLDYAKKSGRLNAASAFVGELLGLKPIISLIDGDTKIVQTVRGDKQIIPQLVRCWEERRDPECDFALVACGAVDEYGKMLQKVLEVKAGKPIPMFNAGASIVINAGPKIVAVVLLGKRRA
jgi:DegV family protein with EDD domain